MRKFLIPLFLLALASPAFAEPYVVKAAIGANGVWLDGVESVPPSDFEAAANARASLQPHITLIAQGAYGFGHSYFRGSGGVRMTATDVEDMNFSIGVGIQYHVSSKPEIRPEGWAPDVTLGWVPWPTQMPAVTLGLQGSYMLDSKQVIGVAAVRYVLPGGFGGAR